MKQHSNHNQASPAAICSRINVPHTWEEPREASGKPWFFVHSVVISYVRYFQFFDSLKYVKRISADTKAVLSPMLLGKTFLIIYLQKYLYMISSLPKPT